jgi:hypothetical protein
VPRDGPPRRYRNPHAPPARVPQFIPTAPAEFRRETQRHQMVGALYPTTGVHPSPSADYPARPTRFSAYPRRDRRSRELAERASTSPAKCVMFRHETHATFKPAVSPEAEDILAGRLEARGRERACRGESHCGERRDTDVPAGP